MIYGLRKLLVLAVFIVLQISTSLFAQDCETYSIADELNQLRVVSQKLYKLILSSSADQNLLTNAKRFKSRANQNLQSLPENIEYCTNAPSCLDFNFRLSLQKFLRIFRRQQRQIKNDETSSNLLLSSSRRLKRRVRKTLKTLQTKNPSCNHQLATNASLRVAFVGDQGLSSDALAALNLVKDYSADLLVIQGDLGYNESDPTTPLSWFREHRKVLGNNFPILASIGNHDVRHWEIAEGYRELLSKQQNRNSDLNCNGDLGIKQSCTFKGLKIIISGIGTSGNDHEAYLQNELQNSAEIWKVCSWHKNQNTLQTGNKGDEVGWQAYELCRQHGAIIASGHEHAYSRTKTLTAMQSRAVDTVWNSPSRILTAPGKTFAFVNGLGGAKIRSQKRCLPATYPYGCNQEWANIYTSSQNALPAILFIDFFVDGDMRLAHGQLINTDHQVVDSFQIVSGN